MVSLKIIIVSLLVCMVKSDNVSDNVGLLIYSPNTQVAESSVSYSLSAATNIITDPNFDITRKTVFYTFGYKESPAAATVKAIVAAFRSRGDYNIIVLDWTTYAADIYPIAVANVKSVSEAFGDAICQLIAAGLKRELIHLVGHSLGGQLSGLTGQETKKNCSITLKRITALDPALPEFLGTPSIFRLSKNDAEFVDVIHTDMYAYGTNDNNGAANFLVNGGTRFQCGCPKHLINIPLSEESLCSHQRSVYYFAESVEQNNFQATPCETDLQFTLGRCPAPETPIYMGLNASPDLPGTYYLNTGSSSPYGRGASGTDGKIKRCSLKSPISRSL